MRIAEWTINKTSIEDWLEVQMFSIREMATKRLICVYQSLQSIHCPLMQMFD
jgi:hypothetical protein